MRLKRIDIQECHQQLVLLAIVFDKICNKYHIPYYMLGGTMLGAVRHKGFIPWDDDMDFGIPRPYFKYFLQVAELELSDAYGFYTPLTQRGYVKIQLKNSKIIENTFERLDDDLYSGIAIDVFPLDGADEDSLAGKIHMKIAFALLRFQEGRFCSLSMRKGLKKIVAFLIKQLPVNDVALARFIDKWIQKKDYGKSKSVANFYGHWKEKEVMDKSVFSQSKSYPFEQIQLSGVAAYHVYLTSLYKDYMKLPSVEERITHADEIYVGEPD